VVPAIVEANNFTTELIVVNCTDLVRNVPLTFAAETIDTPTRATEVVVPLLQPRQQVIIPNFVQWLREQGLAGLSSATTFAGSLFHRGSYYPVYLGARISAQGAQGGFGVFVPEVSAFPVALDRMWLYALKQDSESRTNVVLLNRGGTNSDPDVFRIDLFDGDTGLRVNSIDGIILKPRERRQFGSILAEYAPNTRQGYARIVRTAGTNVFFAFAVVNDGGQAGERTGDGAYVTSVP
jgi:hypothetical protein